MYEVALWGFPAGVIGGRLYFLATSWNEVPHIWWEPFAVWKGGLGIWGGIAAGTLAGLWVLRRRGVDIPAFMDAAAPALLVAGDRPSRQLLQPGAIRRTNDGGAFLAAGALLTVTGCGQGSHSRQAHGIDVDTRIHGQPTRLS